MAGGTQTDAEYFDSSAFGGNKTVSAPSGTATVTYPSTSIVVEILDPFGTAPTITPTSGTAQTSTTATPTTTTSTTIIAPGATGGGGAEIGGLVVDPAGTTAPTGTAIGGSTATPTTTTSTTIIAPGATGAGGGEIGGLVFDPIETPPASGGATGTAGATTATGTVTTQPAAGTAVGGVTPSTLALAPVATVPIGGSAIGGAILQPVAFNPVGLAPAAGVAIGGVIPSTLALDPIAATPVGGSAIGGVILQPIALSPISTTPITGTVTGGSVISAPVSTTPPASTTPTGTATGGSGGTTTAITSPTITAPSGGGTGTGTVSAPVSTTSPTSTAPTGTVAVGQGGVGNIGGQLGIEQPTGTASGGSGATTANPGSVTTSAPAGSATGSTATAGTATGGFSGSISDTAPTGGGTGGVSASGSAGGAPATSAPSGGAGGGSLANGGTGDGVNTGTPPGGSADGQSGTTYTQGVASNVCGDIPPTVPVQIDCSLCGIGFPQAGGRVGISFYGARCSTDTDPPPSYWLGFGSRWAQFRCPNPGEDAELDPNLWYAVSYFGGASIDGCANQYRFRATLTPANQYQVNVSAYVDVLVPTTGGNTWTSYLSLSQTLTEVAGNDTTRYRGRAFASPAFVPVTPSAVGGLGDPVSFARLEIGMESMRLGCGSKGFEIPVCGMWDGAQWLTCLRAFVSSTSDTQVREFAQMGFNVTDCGKPNEPYCDCDRIKILTTSPLTAETQFNATQGYLNDYAVLGLTSGGSPLEVVGITQEIQIGSTVSGIQIVAKRLSNSNALWVCTNDGTGWTCSQATQQQAHSPRIYSVTHGGKSYHLYTLDFPNSELLATECSSGGDLPTTGAGSPYWCVPSGCVQSALQPIDAYGGPYATSLLCAAECSAPALPPLDPDPYWCVDGTCVQAALQPANSTGPYASAAACSGVCQPDATPTDPGYYCVYKYAGSYTWSCEYYADTPTDAPFSYRYSTLSACISGCKSNEPLPPPYPPGQPQPGPSPTGTYWCVFSQDGSRHCVNAPSGAPPATLGGPYSTAGACSDACFSMTGQYWCVTSAAGTGVCVEAYSEPSGAAGGPYATSAECTAVCDMINQGGFQMLPPQQEALEPEPVATPVQMTSAQLIARLRTPCKHRGKRLPLMGYG